MTNEEAKKMLEAKLKCLIAETSGTNYDCNMRLCDGCALNYEQGNMGEQKQACDMAIKALEQQPCEDCISREAVLDIINNPLNIRLDEIIKKLPSVTPQRKRGKWIFREDMGHQYCCSECGCPKPFVNDFYYKKIIGCPYCLADMRGDTDETN